MGILELAQSGSNLSRQTTNVTTTDPFGSALFGTSYILLSVSTMYPCRIRLYSDSASVAIDNSRPSSSFDIDPAVGLVLDTTILNPGKTSFDPPIIGTTFSTSSQTWYHITSSEAQTVQFTTYPIEFYPQYDNTRLVIAVSGSNIDTGSTGLTGEISTPKGFIILSGSASVKSRLRLFSRPYSEIPAAERNRAFGENAITGSSIIADMMFDTGSFSYILSPSLEAYNLQSYSVGSNQVGFMLQNESTSSSATITASLLIYPIED